MAENTQANGMTSQRQRVRSDYGIRYHIVSFILSIALTLLAFWAIASDAVPHAFSVPFIIGLAVIQVIFQLFYWMHLKEKGHEFPLIFLAGGVLVAVLTVLTFVIWLWF
ncbi:cytochrome c oxidase subunit IVB [Bacillaceae bacterium]